MTFTLYLSCVLLAIVLLLLIRRYSSLEFVNHARLLFKTWSVWLASVGSAIAAWTQSFPDAAMQAWASLPGDIRTLIPPHFLGIIGAFMVAMAVLSQFVRQKSLTDEQSKTAGGNR